MLLALAACAQFRLPPPFVPDSDCAEGLRQETVDGRGGNVVVILMDDLGVDKIGAYGEHPLPAPTPNIDALIASGVRFQHAYGYPVCSPGRAALMTGRLAAHTGIGTTVRPESFSFPLPEGEITLPEALVESPLGPWAAGAVGKWHLSTLDAEGAFGPLRQGFDRILGILENPQFAIYPDGSDMGYSHWEKDTDGTLGFVDDYLVSVQTDDALALMASLPEPYLLYVAYSGIHDPVHVPPADLWSQAVPNGWLGQVDAMVEALDAEIGRLLAAVDDHTTVVLASDNGTALIGTRPPADPLRAKDTLYEGGVRVPLVVAGYGVDAPGTVVDGMVHLVDVFATVADLAGVDVGRLEREVDGVSFLPALSDPGWPGRKCVIVDQFGVNGAPDVRRDRSIRDPEYTLVVPHDGPDELYQRSSGAPWEGPDLLLEELDPEAEQAYEWLEGQLERAD